jgi:outer membrane protein assembly factor BamA
LLASPAAAAEPGPPPSPPAAPPAVAPGTPVGEIHIENGNIFDPAKPGENKWLFRLANRLHVKTRPNVIRRQLLLKPGDPYTPEAVAESERILRANRYFYDAHIAVVPRPDGKIDLDVTTRDVWTLQGGVSFGRAGGTNRTSFLVTDVNFLGTGKAVFLSHETTVDRTTSEVGYRDPNLFGGRSQLELSYSDNSDGKNELFRLERPFYALDARWAAGLTGTALDEVTPRYRAGHVVDRFRQQRDLVEVYGGFSPGRVENHTQRFRFGFTYDRNRFDPAAGFPPPAAVPADRTLAYPWVSYERVSDGFIVERDLDKLGRTEDLNLGRQMSLLLGWSTPAFGGDRNRLVASAEAAGGFRPASRALLLADTSSSARWGRDGVENFLWSGRLRYYYRFSDSQLFYAGLRTVAAHRLDPESQILLGGDNGLRGYPLRFTDGDRLVLATVEQRFFSSREFFHLIRLGGAVFFDAGEAWFASAGRQRLLKDIGAGLRIGSSRSARGSVIHLDVAFPLDRSGSSIKAIQWLVSTKETF